MKPRELYGQMLYKLKEKEVKKAIARNLQEKTINFSIKQLQDLKRVYEADTPTEINKASIKELERIIKQRKRLKELVERK